MNQYLVRGLLGILTLMVVVNFLIFPPNGEPGGYSYSVLKSSRTDLSTNVLLNKTDEVYLSSSLDEKLSGGKLKVISIIGTRPETIKMFPIIKMLQEHPDISSIVLASGQHQKMVEPLLKTFGIHVDINLNVMVAQQGLTAMTERLVNRIGKAIEHTKPDWILVQGDTSTAFIAGLISFYHKIPVGHVEAGLRTYHRYSPFPEEINRRLLGSLSSIHFSPTTVSSQHLAMEGIPASRIHVTGNTVIDALKWMAEQPPSNAASALMDAVYTGIADRSKVRIVLVTAHRRENLGEPLTHICNAILKLVQTVPDIHVVFPIHLNPAVQQVVRSILSDNPRIILWDPLDYDVFAYLMKYVHLVMTDSGGIQEEATAFSVPILVLRDTTERPEGVSAGMAKLIGTDQETIFNEGSKMLTDDAYYQTMVRANSPYGDGTAAKIIVDLLLSKTGELSGDDEIMATAEEEAEVEIPIPPPKPKWPEERTVNELLKLESNFPENGHGKGIDGYTAVISSYQRPQALSRILDTLNGQTIPPTEIWVSVFSSKFEDDYRKTVTKYIADHPDSPAKIQIVTGDPQFTYFARFQLALLAKTRYVALLDDDTIPSGKMAFRNMFHTACLKSNAYLGMYGMKGHIISPYQNGGQHQYASFFEHMPERIVGADVVGGLWFMKREWIKFMFIEDPITISTGEDVHLTAMLSKHGNIPTFLFPIDRADPETFLHSSDFLDLSEVNPTTGNDHKMYNGEAYEVHHLRNSLAWWSFNRGQTRPLAMQFWQHTNVLFFVHSLNQARGLKDTYSYLSNAANTMKKEKVLTPYYAVAGQEISTDDQRGATLIEYQKAMGSNIDWGNMRAGLFCLEIGRNSYGLEVGKDWISRTLLAFHQTIANIQPVAVILTTVDVDSTTVAAAMTAVDYGTPLIVLDPIAQQLEKPHSKWRRVLLSLANVVVDSEREIGVFLDSIVLKSTQAEAKLNN